MKKHIDHADIVVTHRCNFNCQFCIDKYRNSPEKCENDISIKDVKKFLDMLKYNAIYDKSFGNEKLPVLLLGGEPTVTDISLLKNIATEIKARGFSPHMSTNGINKEKIIELLNYFDWIQITIHSLNEVDFWRPYKNNINIKIAGDQSLSYERLIKWMELVKEFPRKSVSMYFDTDFNDLCKDTEVLNLLNLIKFERLGSYFYGFYKGIRFKKCVKGQTNIIEEPLIPKLYPNGNYNKTWQNEDLDDYISGVWKTLL